ncbi:MAG: 4-(cytidine 5'-diphospho)-2-C-methyl-D-erythritol kinase, partial [Actinomycetota bacterium]|nr:4-(cytidine 5'-diphospho)-2-C-methyl-D-erythritol kinase [Actinomycetota bacterium]
ELGSTMDVLHRLAEGLGSDVSYFLHGGPAEVSGRGEVVEGFDIADPLWFVLALSGRALSTATVYAAWDDGGQTGPDGAAPARAAVASGDPSAVTACIRNDLEAAAIDLMPELAAVKERLTASGALAVGMSGSGPTLYGLCRDREHARQVAGSAAGVCPRIEVVSSVATAVAREG